MAQTATEEYIGRVGSRWWLWILAGLIAIAAGVLAIVYPDITLRIIGLIFGIWLVSFGVWALIAAFDPLIHPALSVLRIVVGIVGILAGLTALVRPDDSVLVVLLVIAFWFIIAGIALVIEGIANREGRFGKIILGLLGIAAGVVLLQNPDMGLDALALVAGIGLTVWGVAMIVAGFDVRRLRPA